MCVYSAIIDKFQPQFIPWDPLPPAPLHNPDALAEIIRQFIEARQAAIVVDKALGTPDCEDPEKLALVARVAELEALLKIKGTYLLKDGEWYLHSSGAYCTLRSSARLFTSKEEALNFAATLEPKPRVVRLRKRS